MTADQTAPTGLLDTFLRFADAVQANAERAHRSVYAETCPCGGSVEVGREATAAERRRIQSMFWGRHQHCRPAPPTATDERRDDEIDYWMDDDDE